MFSPALPGRERSFEAVRPFQGFLGITFGPADFWSPASRVGSCRFSTCKLVPSMFRWTAGDKTVPLFVRGSFLRPSGLQGSYQHAFVNKAALGWGFAGCGL